MTDAPARILALFRETYSGCQLHPETHLADCPGAEVVKHEIMDEADFQFNAIIRCGHARPIGYSRGPKEDDDG